MRNESLSTPTQARCGYSPPNWLRACLLRATLARQASDRVAEVDSRTSPSARAESGPGRRWDGLPWRLRCAADNANAAAPPHSKHRRRRKQGRLLSQGGVRQIGPIRYWLNTNSSRFCPVSS